MKSTDRSRAVGRLLEIMAKLRSPGGCPWDAEQTPESLKPYLLEEAYEVLEAIEEGDVEAIKEELGDLLLQVVFHARIFEERGEFDFASVADTIADKLLRRHPHVFGDAEIGDRRELNAQWDRIKAEEKKSRGKTLGGIPKDLPALMRAQKTLEKADLAGFDTRDATRPRCTVAQEGITEDEVGDTLLRLVEQSRRAGIDAEGALRKSIDRFVRSLEAPEPKEGRP